MTSASKDAPKAHEEILLRCDCGVELLQVDLWFTTNAADFRTVDKARLIELNEGRGRWFDEGYLTVTQGYGWNQPWKLRLKAVWSLLRGREHLLSSVILRPEQAQKLREFFATAGA